MHSLYFSPLYSNVLVRMLLKGFGNHTISPRAMALIQTPSAGRKTRTAPQIGRRSSRNSQTLQKLSSLAPASVNKSGEEKELNFGRELEKTDEFANDRSINKIPAHQELPMQKIEEEKGLPLVTDEGETITQDADSLQIALPGAVSGLSTLAPGVERSAFIIEGLKGDSLIRAKIQNLGVPAEAIQSYGLQMGNSFSFLRTSPRARIAAPISLQNSQIHETASERVFTNNNTSREEPSLMNEANSNNTLDLASYSLSSDRSIVERSSDENSSVLSNLLPLSQSPRVNSNLGSILDHLLPQIVSSLPFGASPSLSLFQSIRELGQGMVNFRFSHSMPSSQRPSLSRINDSESMTRTFRTMPGENSTDQELTSYPFKSNPSGAGEVIMNSGNVNYSSAETHGEIESKAMSGKADDAIARINPEGELLGAVPIANPIRNNRIPSLGESSETGEVESRKVMNSFLDDGFKSTGMTTLANRITEQIFSYGLENGQSNQANYFPALGFELGSFRPAQSGVIQTAYEAFSALNSSILSLPSAHIPLGIRSGFRSAYVGQTTTIEKESYSSIRHNLDAAEWIGQDENEARGGRQFAQQQADKGGTQFSSRENIIHERRLGSGIAISYVDRIDETYPLTAIEPTRSVQNYLPFLNSISASEFKKEFPDAGSRSVALPRTLSAYNNLPPIHISSLLFSASQVHEKMQSSLMMLGPNGGALRRIHSPNSDGLSKVQNGHAMPNSAQKNHLQKVNGRHGSSLAHERQSVSHLPEVHSATQPSEYHRLTERLVYSNNLLAVSTLQLPLGFKSPGKLSNPTLLILSNPRPIKANGALHRQNTPPGTVASSIQDVSSNFGNMHHLSQSGKAFDTGRSLLDDGVTNKPMFNIGKQDLPNEDLSLEEEEGEEDENEERELRKLRKRIEKIIGEELRRYGFQL